VQCTHINVVSNGMRNKQPSGSCFQYLESIFSFFFFHLLFYFIFNFYIRNEFVYCGYCFFLICTPRNLYEYICFAFSAFNVLHVIVFVLLLCFIFFIHRHCQLCHAVVAAVSYLTSFPSYYCRHQVVLSTVVLSEIS